MECGKKKGKRKSRSIPAGPRSYDPNEARKEGFLPRHKGGRSPLRKEVDRRFTGRGGGGNRMMARHEKA